MSLIVPKENSESFWINCPSDILMLIYRWLDLKSLINCMHVSESWSDTVHYYCEHNNLWGKLLEAITNKKSITFKEKSTLNDQDLFLSARRWLNIQDSKIILQHAYKEENNKNISVLKEMLIVRTQSFLNFFHIKKMEIIKSLENHCLNYIETSSLIAELTLPNFEVIGYNILTLTNKLHHNVCVCAQVKEITLFDINIFKVHLNACYVIDIRNVLWVYRTYECQWDCKSLARYYGNKESITTIHIYGDDIYILLRSGDILKVDLKCKKIDKLFNLEVPLYYFDRQAFMFHKFSVITEVPSNKRHNYLQKERRQTAMACPGLTCVIEHGPVLIIGYENGKIEFFLIDNVVNDDPPPALSLYLQSYVSRSSSLDSLKVKSLDVYEDRDGHHLFVATEYSIYELLIT